MGSRFVRRAALVLVVLAGVASAAAAQDAIPIAAIHANLGTYTGQIVTVEGAITVPVGYRGPGTSQYSGYVQDGSGRGINLFGGSTSPPFSLTVAGNRVQVTGEVAVFSNTTVEMTNITTVTLVSSGSPLAPIQLSTLAANDARWEGTYIEVSGNVDSVGALSSGARNYWLNDGSGRIVARVYDAVGTGTFTVGQHVTARGAGTNFNGLYEFYVGRAVDMTVTTPAADTTPPVLAGAWAPSPTQVIVTFGEALGASGGNAANYTVFVTATPATTVGVGSVSLAGPVATLTLSGSLAAGTGYSVRASNVADLANNTVPAPIETAILRVTGPVDTTPPSLTGASASTLTSVSATFSEAIDPVTGGATANYLVFPAGNPGSPIAVSSVSVASATATLTLGGSLTAGSNYTLRAQNVQDLAGNAMPAPQVQNFTAPGGGSFTPIADIQNNRQQYKGQTVTIQGQVYIPNNYRGTLSSGYIQDSSNRGINLFGSGGANNALLQDIGNLVTVTGTVDTFFTTTEIVSITNVTLLSSGNAPLQPVVLSTGEAASSQWEGTYIQVTGTISAVARPGATPTGTNYTINDGSGNIVVRVVDTLGAPTFSTGQTITARGAGSLFSPDYQVLVGIASNIFEGSGNDTTPPTLTGASAPTLTSVRANFSEAIDTVTGGMAANYTVYPTANPAATVPVSSVSVSGIAATLSLGSSLTAGTSYTVRAQNVQDLAGNVMTGPQTANFTPSAGPQTTPIADIQNNLRQYKGQTVTIQGQVYIPNNYRGTLSSGYIQDSSNRGINLFGSGGANNALLQDIGNLVTVTGTVDTFFTTIEIVSISNVTLLSGGNPPLQPAVLSASAASSTQWEGTYIQVSGRITAVARPGATPTGTNYTINDGSGTIVVRVVDTLGAPTFAVGQTITARGAGAYFSPDYEVLVGIASNVFVGSGGDTTPPSVLGATTPSLTQVNVTFSEPVTALTGGNAANYTMFETAAPTVSVPVVSSALAGNRASTALGLGSTLVSGRGYTLRVVNLADDSGNTMTSPQNVTFTAGVGPQITPIADIQNNLRQYKGQQVTVQGQVYIPSNYRGTVTSGYIQDQSGRGINIFGSGFNSATFQNTGNIVRVTATVDTFFTTIELVNGTGATLVSSGNPPLQPVPLTCAAASSNAWEGTYILATGTITAKSRPGATPTATNYSIQDATGTLVVRVVDALGAPDFAVGTLITARGAGAFFSPDYEVLVGETNAVFEGEPQDTFPPAVLAALATGSQTVRVDFNEAVSPNTAQVAANYEVFRTSQPTQTIAVTAAQRSQDAQVTLTLGAPLDVKQGWTLRVRNVTDLVGNAIPATGITHVIEEAPAENASIDGPAYTFLPKIGETYPITFTVPSAVTSGKGHVLVRIFDMQGRLQRTLFDSRYSTGFVNNRVTVTWDGRDEFQSFVPAGAYVAHLLVSFESADTDTQTAQMPVVVASRLNR